MENNFIVVGKHIKNGKEQTVFHLTNGRSKERFIGISDIENDNIQFGANIGSSHTNDFYLIVWVRDGHSICRVDGENYSVDKDDIMFLNPLQSHKIVEIKDSKGVFIAFTNHVLDFMDPIIKRYLRNEVFNTIGGTSICKLDASAKQIIEDDFLRLNKEYTSEYKDILYIDRMSALLTIFLYDLLRHGSWKNKKTIMESDHDLQLFSQFSDLLEDNFREYHGVKEYCQMLNVSLSTLNNSVKKISGCSPAKLIDGRIIDEAKAIITENDNFNVKEIANALGFTECSYFLKFFKRQTGISPLDFKNEIAEKE